MFETETDTIIAAARQRIPHGILDVNTIVLKDVIAADIPPALRTFFRADVELMLAEEIGSYRKTSRFNYNHPEIQSLQHQINSIVVMNYVFGMEEFHKRLDDAVHMLMNYLVRPQWTLTNVLFESQETISAPSLMRLLRYFGPFEYLRGLILRYIEDRHVSAFTRAEFLNLVWKVDGHFIRRKTGYEVAKILTPLYEFTAYPAYREEYRLPVKALVKYFSDKGLKTVARMLEDEAGTGLNAVSQAELGELLERKRRMSGAFELESPPGEQPEEPPVQEEAARVEEEPAAPAGENAQPESATANSGETATDEETMPEIESAPSPDELLAESGKPSLLPVISESERRKFVRKIFKQDYSAFLNTLRHLDELSSWRQASVYIDEIFIQNDIDPYSPEAVRFIDIVQEKFYPRKS